MNTRTFIKTTAAGLLGSALSSAETATPPSIYDSVEAPPGLVRQVIWWACQESPSQRYEILDCGAPCPVLTERHVSENARKRMTAECNAFWTMSKPIIQATKGRCNWHPAVDTDENHVGSCGTNFHSVRHGSEFFMEGWPPAERMRFCNLARSFAPMFLEECEGLLEFREGQPIPKL